MLVRRQALTPLPPLFSEFYSLSMQRMTKNDLGSFPESQAQNLVLTVLYVPSLLDTGYP